MVGFWAWIIIGLSSLLNTVWDGVKYVASTAIDLIKEGLDWMKKSIDWLLSSAPTWFKRYLFLFLILSVGSFVISALLSLNYACLENNNLRIYPSVYAAGYALISASFEDFENSTTNYDEFIITHTYLYKQPTESEKDIIKVQCIDASPRLTLFEQDILNYKLWVVLFLITIMIKFIGIFKHI